MEETSNSGTPGFGHCYLGGRWVQPRTGCHGPGSEANKDEHQHAGFHTASIRTLPTQCLRIWVLLLQKTYSFCLRFQSMHFTNCLRPWRRRSCFPTCTLHLDSRNYYTAIGMKISCQRRKHECPCRERPKTSGYFFTSPGPNHSQPLCWPQSLSFTENQNP